MPMTTSEALSVLLKEAQEERNWRSARAQLIDALTEFAAIEERLANSAGEEAALRRRVAELSATRDELQGVVFTLQAQVNGFDTALAEKRRLEELGLADLRQERQTEEQRLLDIQTQLEAVKNQLNRHSVFSIKEV